MIQIIFSIIISCHLALTASISHSQETPPSEARTITTDELLGVPSTTETTPGTAQENATESTNPAPEQVATTTNAVENNAEKNLKEKKSHWGHGSIMFPTKSFEEINAAIRSHSEGVPLEILLPHLFAPEPVAEQPAPQQQAPVNNAPEPQQTDTSKTVTEAKSSESADKYSLKSILYFSPNNWTLWLNDQKISAGDTIPGAEIVSVTKEYALIIKRSTSPDALLSNWRNIFIELDNNFWSSKNGNIIINSVAGDISFILRPNQSFIANSIDIIEGYGLQEASASTNKTEGSDDATEPTIKTETSPTQATNTESIEVVKMNLQKYIKQIELLKSALGVQPANQETPTSIPAGSTTPN